MALLKEKLGFDEAFNYNEDKDLNSALKRFVTDGRKNLKPIIKVRTFNWIVFDGGFYFIL